MHEAYLPAFLMPIATAFAAGPLGQFLLYNSTRRWGNAQDEDSRLLRISHLHATSNLERDVGRGPDILAVKQVQVVPSICEQRNAALMGTALEEGGRRKSHWHGLISLVGRLFSAGASSRAVTGVSAFEGIPPAVLAPPQHTCLLGVVS